MAGWTLAVLLPVGLLSAWCLDQRWGIVSITSNKKQTDKLFTASRSFPSDKPESILHQPQWQASRALVTLVCCAQPWMCTCLKGEFRLAENSSQHGHCDVYSPMHKLGASQEAFLCFRQEHNFIQKRSRKEQGVSYISLVSWLLPDDTYLTVGLLKNIKNKKE